MATNKPRHGYERKRSQVQGRSLLAQKTSNTHHDKLQQIIPMAQVKWIGNSAGSVYVFPAAQ
jgi:hypothetical protein